MATYTKRSGNNLTTSLSVQYGADKIVKSFSRTYQETSVIKKIVGENDQGQEIVKFNTVSNFEAGTFKDCKYLGIDLYTWKAIHRGETVDVSGLSEEAEEYLVSVAEAWFGRTETLIKSVSTPIFGKINF